MSERLKNDETANKPGSVTAPGGGPRRARTVRTDGNRMWDVADVADYLKVSKDWVRRHYNMGNLPGNRLPSGHLRFEPETVSAYARGDWKRATAASAEPTSTALP